METTNKRVEAPIILEIKNKEDQKVHIKLLCRIDTEDEVEYYRHGGILHFVLRSMMEDSTQSTKTS